MSAPSLTTPQVCDPHGWRLASVSRSPSRSSSGPSAAIQEAFIQESGGGWARLRRLTTTIRTSAATNTSPATTPTAIAPTWLPLSPVAGAGAALDPGEATDDGAGDEPGAVGEAAGSDEDGGVEAPGLGCCPGWPCQSAGVGPGAPGWVRPAAARSVRATRTTRR